jgi:ankyrin repeat protein
MAALAAAGGGPAPAAPAPAASAAPFRGPAADSPLGERLIDVLPFVAENGFALDVSQHVALCGATWRRGNLGATNDVMARSLAMQAPWAAAARGVGREDVEGPSGLGTIYGSTQLIRAALRNDLLRVRHLVQLGAPINAVDKGHYRFSALLWACCEGFERVAEALLDGKYEGRGAEVHSLVVRGWTPLIFASRYGHEGIVRLLLARGARQELQGMHGYTALHWAVSFNEPGVVAILCGAAGAAAALAVRDSSGRTPLAHAIYCHRVACEAVLRAHGATA